jgi:hypothetical protein
MIRHQDMGGAKDPHVGYGDVDGGVPYLARALTRDRHVLTTARPPIVVHSLTDYTFHTRVYWQAEEDTVVHVGVRNFGVKSTMCCFFTVPKDSLIPIPDLVGDV